MLSIKHRLKKNKKTAATTTTITIVQSPKAKDLKRIQAKGCNDFLFIFIFLFFFLSFLLLLRVLEIACITYFAISRVTLYILIFFSSVAVLYRRWLFRTQSVRRIDERSFKTNCTGASRSLPHPTLHPTPVKHWLSFGAAGGECVSVLQLIHTFIAITGVVCPLLPERRNKSLSL